MADDSGFSIPQVAAIGGLMTVLGGTGGHIVGGSTQDDIPLTTGTVSSCASFVAHGREHERHICQYEINKIRTECLEFKAVNGSDIN